MFTGHYAPAVLAAALPRARERGLGVGTLFIAAQLVDLAFFSFVLLGVENMREVPGFTAMNPMDLYHMPYTHSLIGALGFAAAWAIGARLLRCDWPAAWIGAAVVASHWLLDLLVHAPDLTLTGVGRRYGFGLWNHPTIEMPLELGLIALALVFYASRTRATGWQGKASLITLIAMLALLQAVNWFAPQSPVTIDPVPPATPLTALAAYAILTALAWWTAATRAPGAGPAVHSL
ncbi:hypothetical protein M0208_18080 [Sphingomonas sp. SUN019]|uniref:hypothetical protein n=1 Tax=Sphingomonas sp. SUN019 TaxID=2937788 RepID=UPI00216420F5|nr:hypothetical protein [Sphingomonas sp. SUN019]UVO52324.1 hypothetical protein M0208_18080 [Sphingomonas sp. SUN019]